MADRAHGACGRPRITFFLKLSGVTRNIAETERNRKNLYEKVKTVSRTAKLGDRVANGTPPAESGWKFGKSPSPAGASGRI
jgi:hypothetical protein